MLKYPVLPHKQHGFTLIELMVTVSILAIIAMIAAPSFTPLIERWRVRSAAEALQSTIYYARSEAIKRGGGVTITANDEDWANGWVVADREDNPLQETAALTNLEVRPGDDEDALPTTLHLDRWGMVSASAGGAATALDFVVAPSGKNENTARMCATSDGGRIQVKKDGSAC